MLVYLIFNIIFTVIFSKHTNHQNFGAQADLTKINEPRESLVILTFAQIKRIVTVFLNVHTISKVSFKAGK